MQVATTIICHICLIAIESDFCEDYLIFKHQKANFLLLQLWQSRHYPVDIGTSVSIDSSDRSESSDTIHFHIKKWSVNARNSHKRYITHRILILAVKTDGLIISWWKFRKCLIIQTCLINQHLPYNKGCDICIYLYPKFG